MIWIRIVLKWRKYSKIFKNYSKTSPILLLDDVFSELDDEKKEWYIRDGQWDKETKEKWSRSLNGTYVNSEKVTEEGHKIIPGDIISIGDIKLRVEAY